MDLKDTWKPMTRKTTAELKQTESEAYKFSNCYVDNNEKKRKRPNKGMRIQSFEKYYKFISIEKISIEYIYIK